MPELDEIPGYGIYSEVQESLSSTVKTQSSQTKSRKICFFGLFGQHNFGNDCTLQAMIYNARRYLPDAEFNCVCTGTQDIAVKHNIPSFPMTVIPGKAAQGKSNSVFRLLRKVFLRISREIRHGVEAFKALKDTEMLVAPGTGLLVDHTTGFRGYPYHVFKWSLIAKLRRCKMLIVSIGAGPIDHPLSRWFIKKALSSAHYRSYRDSFSKRYIESIGFDTRNDRVYPDLAFSLPDAMITERATPDMHKPIIGVGVVDYYGHSNDARRWSENTYHDYIHLTSAFVAWLLESKYTVRLLIGDLTYDSEVRQDLMELIEKQGAQLGEGQVINEPIRSVEQLLSQLERTDIVISPRFHNIILAMMLNKPVIALSHDEKFESLMAGFELNEYCLSLTNLRVERLIEKFIELQENTEVCKTIMNKKTVEYRRTLDEQYTFIFNHD